MGYGENESGCAVQRTEKIARTKMMHNNGAHLNGAHIELFVTEYFTVAPGCLQVHTGPFCGKMGPDTDFRGIRAMNPTSFLDQIAGKLSEIAANSPAKDIEKNVKAMASSAFTRMDLVTREEFDIQAEMLSRAREQLAALEKRVTELEAQLAAKSAD